MCASSGERQQIKITYACWKVSFRHCGIDINPPTHCITSKCTWPEHRYLGSVLAWLLALLYFPEKTTDQTWQNTFSSAVSSATRLKFHNTGTMRLPPNLSSCFSYHLTTTTSTTTAAASFSNLHTIAPSPHTSFKRHAHYHHHHHHHYHNNNDSLCKSAQLPLHSHCLRRPPQKKKKKKKNWEKRHQEQGGQFGRTGPQVSHTRDPVRVSRLLCWGGNLAAIGTGQAGNQNRCFCTDSIEETTFSGGKRRQEVSLPFWKRCLWLGGELIIPT